MDELTDVLRRRLVLTEEEKDGISIGEDDFNLNEVDDEEVDRSLVGTLLTEKNFRSDYMKTTMVDAWRLSGKVEIRDIGKNLFIFTFENFEDKRKVTSKGPWNFENAILLLENPMKSINPKKMAFNETIFWIQIHNLPLLAMKKSVLLKIGNSIGKVIEVEESERGVRWGAVMRIRVKVNIKKPLLRGSIIKCPDIGEVWIQYKYERLPRYCRWCGILGHVEGGCSLKKDTGVGNYNDLRAVSEVMRSKIYESKKQSSYASTNFSSERNEEAKEYSGKDDNNSVTGGGDRYKDGGENNRMTREINENILTNRLCTSLVNEVTDTASSPVKKDGGNIKNTTVMLKDTEIVGMDVSEDNSVEVENNSSMVGRSSWKRRARENKITTAETSTKKKRKSIVEGTSVTKEVYSKKFKGVGQNENDQNRMGNEVEENGMVLKIGLAAALTPKNKNDNVGCETEGEVKNLVLTQKTGKSRSDKV